MQIIKDKTYEQLYHLIGGVERGEELLKQFCEADFSAEALDVTTSLVAMFRVYAENVEARIREAKEES